jgi:tetratricopeptide (TPR) repeat protein
VIPGERCLTGRDAFPHHCALNLHNLFSADVKHLEVERPFVGVAVQRDRIGFVDREASGDATARVEVQTKMMELDGSGRVLRLKVRSPEQVRLGIRRSVNPEAQDLYFRGLYALNSGTAEAAQNAINYFHQVIAKDANFAGAHASLALAYSQWLPGENSPREKMPKAREEGLKALQIDETLSEGHTALGFIELCHDWNWAGAEKEFKRALELEPNSVVAHEYYARELVILARADEGLAQLKQVRDLHVNLSTDYFAWLSYLSRAYGDALELAQEIIAVDPNNAWGHYQAALVYERTGKQTEAVQHYLKCRKPHPRRSTENRALASRVRQGRC